MGCFNLSGFYSHAPIEYGDRIGAILCVVNPNRPGCPLGATGYGYHPVMAPVYGKYNEYGGIEDIDESVTTKLFKDVVGIDFIDFMEKNYRNTETTYKTKDNDNHFDNIPDYQKYLAKLISFYFPGDELNKAMPKEDIEMLNNWYYEENTNSCIHIIYEHESVLKELEKIGTPYFDYVSMRIDKLRKVYGEDFSDAFNFEIRDLFTLGNCSNNDNDVSLYAKICGWKNLLKHEEYISEIKSIYAISHALNQCGGYFCASKYDSQDTSIKEKNKINTIITNIIKSKL